MEQIQWIIGSDNLPSIHRENNLQNLKKMDLHEFNGQTRLLGEHLNEQMYAETILKISRIGKNTIGTVSAFFVSFFWRHFRISILILSKILNQDNMSMVQLKSNVDFVFLTFFMQLISNIFWKCWKLIYGISVKCRKYIA